ncbi:MAG: amidohydrolase family protein, partial [Planctomycetaceae bacterium]|nr:amidohydrolase family protein [Planctomycetaceae bacterium]
AFPLRSLLDAGAEVVFGSDAPVEPADPALWIRAAVERTTPDGRPEGGWWPAEKVGRESAVRCTVEAPLSPGAPLPPSTAGRGGAWGEGATS